MTQDSHVNLDFPGSQTTPVSVGSDPSETTVQLGSGSEDTSTGPVVVSSVTETSELSEDAASAEKLEALKRRVLPLVVLAVVGTFLVWLGLNTLPYYGVDMEGLTRMTKGRITDTLAAVTPNGPQPVVDILADKGVDPHLLAGLSIEELAEAASEMGVETAMFSEFTSTAAQSSAASVAAGEPPYPIDQAVAMTLLVGLLSAGSVFLGRDHPIMAVLVAWAAGLVLSSLAGPAIAAMQPVPFIGGSMPIGTLPLLGQTITAVGLVAAAATVVVAFVTGLRGALGAVVSKFTSATGSLRDTLDAIRTLAESTRSTTTGTTESSPPNSHGSVG